MDSLTKDIRWPSITVSRSIGINGIVLFISMYKILKIKPSESKVSIQDMEDLIWELVKTFHPSIEKTATILGQ